MKFLILSSLLLAISCGKTDYTGKTSLGQEKSFNPISADSALTSKLGIICQALGQKAQVLPQLAGVSNFVFDLSKRGCSDLSAGPVVPTTVQIQKPYNDFQFKLVGTSTDFVFPNVETNTSGVMGEICSALGSLTNPMKLSNGNVIWMSVGIQSDNCRGSSTEDCLSIETGYLSYTSQLYVVSSQEWIKFVTTMNQPRTGFYTSRRLISNVLCAKDQSQETLAILK